MTKAEAKKWLRIFGLVIVGLVVVTMIIIGFNWAAWAIRVGSPNQPAVVTPPPVVVSPVAPPAPPPTRADPSDPPRESDLEGISDEYFEEVRRGRI